MCALFVLVVACSHTAAPSGVDAAHAGATARAGAGGNPVATKGGAGGADAGKPKETGVVDAEVMDAAGGVGGSDAGPAINSVAGIVLANDATIFYSPGNWAAQNTSSMESVNAGAYFRTIFSGSTCTLSFDLTADGMPLSEIEVSVDSAPPVKSNLASVVDCTPSTKAPEHLLEVTVKSTSQALDRWSAAPATGILFESVTLDIGAYTRKPEVAPCQGLIFGDSITEGILTTPGAGGENDQADAALGWAYRQKKLLGCEIGVVGFGRQGLGITGNGKVPIFGDTWRYVFSTFPRSFSDIGFILVNQGTNDGSNDETAAELTFLNGALKATKPATPIIILRPFNGSQAATWQTAIASVNNPRVHYVDTTGFFDTAKSADGLHPNADADATIAPLISAKVGPLVAGSRGWAN